MPGTGNAINLDKKLTSTKIAKMDNKQTKYYIGYERVIHATEKHKGEMTTGMVMKM